MVQLFAAAIWKVLLASLLIGAGLPALFALGVRSMAYGVGGEAEDSRASGQPVGKVLAILCFAIVLAAVATGITIIVAAGFGKSVSFEHIYPVLVSKER